jgi:hypothetical protein
MIRLLKSVFKPKEIVNTYQLDITNGTYLIPSPKRLFVETLYDWSYQDFYFHYIGPNSKCEYSLGVL